MMDKEKQNIFGDFLRKAEKRLEEKKVMKTCLVKIPSLGETIRIRGLRTSEIAEVTETDTSNDPYAGDKYSVYIATVEPDLREIASKLKADGKIEEYLDVVDMFDIYEVRQLADKIMDLSGVTGKGKIEVITENLKN